MMASYGSIRLSQAFTLFTLLAGGMFFSAARADEKKAPDFSRGALCGKVVDAATGKPIADATVALLDDKGKVIAWTKTDAEGRYRMAADAIQVLRIRPSRRQGLLDQIVKGIGDVVNAPVKVATGVVSTAQDVVTKPGNTIKAAATSAVTGTPVPLAAQIAGTTAGNLKSDSEQKTREAAVQSIMSERAGENAEKERTLKPGEITITVSASAYKAMKNTAGTFWLEPQSLPDKKPAGPQAWLETVKLAPEKSDKNSEVVQEAILLSEAHLTPPLAPAGTPVKLDVKLQTPSGPPMPVRLFARENKTRKAVELTPQPENRYAGELLLDAKMPSGETMVTVIALRAVPLEITLPKSKTDPLLTFVQRLDDLNAGKPYVYDPRIFASENRLDITLTILPPKP